MLFKKLTEDAVTPEYAHESDSGFDLYTAEEVTILPGERAAIPTGLKFFLPRDLGMQIRPRSGNSLSGKYGDVLLGTIDNGYTGEVKIITANYSNKPITIPKGTKLAQAVMEKVINVSFTETTEDLPNTNRGEKGFGSTGVR